jgi:hypothetical protein
MRLREDELFVRRIKESLPKGLKNNLQMLDLNLKDAPIRLRIPLDEVCKTPVNPADPSIEKIRKALTRQSELGTMEALVVPAALGNHVDHLTLREAALPFANGIPSAFYEDLPYIATHPSALEDLGAVRDAAAERGSPLTPFTCHIESAVERKRKLILGYASQIEEDVADTICNVASDYNGCERLWVNEEWISRFSHVEQ